MSRVRIQVESRVLGDVEVEQDDLVGSLDGKVELQRIDRLVEQTATMIRAAYGIKPTPTRVGPGSSEVNR